MATTTAVALTRIPLATTDTSARARYDGRSSGRAGLDGDHRGPFGATAGSCSLAAVDNRGGQSTPGTAGASSGFGSREYSATESCGGIRTTSSADAPSLKRRFWRDLAWRSPSQIRADAKSVSGHPLLPSGGNWPSLTAFLRFIPRTGYRRPGIVRCVRGRRRLPRPGAGWRTRACPKPGPADPRRHRVVNFLGGAVW